jgi:hypothetical protein
MKKHQKGVKRGSKAFLKSFDEKTSKFNQKMS